MDNQTHSLLSLYVPHELMEPVRTAPISIYTIGSDLWSFAYDAKTPHFYRTMICKARARGKVRVRNCGILVFTGEPRPFDDLSCLLDPLTDRPRSIDIMAAFSLLRKNWNDPRNEVNHHSIIEFERKIVPIEAELRALLSGRLKAGTYKGAGYELRSYPVRKPERIGPGEPMAADRDLVIIAIAALVCSDFKLFCEMAAAQSTSLKMKFTPGLTSLSISYRARGRTRYFKHVIKVASRDVAFEVREYILDPIIALQSIAKCEIIHDPAMPSDTVRVDLYRDRVDFSGHIPGEVRV